MCRRAYAPRNPFVPRDFLDIWTEEDAETGTSKILKDGGALLYLWGEVAKFS